MCRRRNMRCAAPPTNWTASILLARIRSRTRHWTAQRLLRHLLQAPAYVAAYQTDREHPARPFPQALAHVAKPMDRAAPAAPFVLSTGPCATGEQDARAPFGLFQTK
jgi:hypothetical protein